jgi:hypothetical protein
VDQHLDGSLNILSGFTLACNIGLSKRKILEYLLKTILIC